MLKSLYKKLVIDQPLLGLSLPLILLVSLAFFIPRFHLDASAESLVLEGDQDLLFYRALQARYGAGDYLIITYTPKRDLFADETLAQIRRLTDELQAHERVESVTNLLNVPLINSPAVSSADLQGEVPTLESARTDRDLARQEFTHSPLYRDLIVSRDGKATAMQVFFKRDEEYLDLRQQRDGMREKSLHTPLNAEEKHELARLNREFRRVNDRVQLQEQLDLAQIRAILEPYRSNAQIHLGGVTLVTSDMIDYIAHDIKTFGAAVLGFLILLLLVFFGKPRWVLIPMLICVASGIGIVGFLGLMEWRVTVVSSNFISLMLIITLSLTVHLVVRYRELHSLDPQGDHRQRVWETMRSKASPAFYTAITTMVAFGSLVVSGIRPVMDFGWMMVFGVGLAFVLTFLIFPSALQFVRAGQPSARLNITARVTAYAARLIEKRALLVTTIAVVVAVAGIVGISKLRVDNRFIDYFKSSTEIYQGILTIDQHLGGSAPLDVVLNPTKEFFEELEYLRSENMLDDNIGITGASFWFNMFRLGLVEQIHDYLEGLPETGKVLSIATTAKLLRQLNNDKELDNVSLAVLYKRLPDNVRQALITPYMTEDGNQIRFDIRLFDSDKTLQRHELLQKIHSDLKSKFGLSDDQIKLSGMTVLYNNLLQSLFRSQILTLGVVFLAIMLMFMVLFRSIRISVLAIIPNIFAAVFVLGLMGWLGIPLDIMTITIAAITIGIGVDDTIHYVHRFMEEFPKDRNYWASIRRCHSSIGRAMYYTSVTITLGFSILVLSSFVPTIYFGMLTGVAMIVALLANFLLLPLLLVFFRPLGQPSAETS
ncbi:MAG: MMPL family transporter [Gammaproteobacteria bacterium]|nr:MMPL family transporter [Gammaproteobacteria bacterium]